MALGASEDLGEGFGCPWAMAAMAQIIKMGTGHVSAASTGRD